ncbi:MAG: phosphoribosylamine--glycine ligase [Desulfobacterota bacterium]|nr:phosphoribosylamine--glycine ligase [Thermodesulfobacteriota bacterium]
MNVLIIGSGGREHALAWKIAQSPHLTKLFCAPGNAGIASLATCVDIAADDIYKLRDFALQHHIDLTVVGPELPLTLGIADVFQEAGLRVFGPSRAAARLEGSKVFAKKLMQHAGIPTADFAVFDDPESARRYVIKKGGACVVKVDGLAAGKGVFPCATPEEACTAITRIMVDNEFGSAGNAIVIEEFLEGEEASFICVTDGITITPLPSSQDHKRVFDDDRGPNTGGMGAYSPAPVVTPDVERKVMTSIMEPLLHALSSHGIEYQGVIYAGLMIHNNLPRVLEFNVRFGDPETQPIVVRLDNDLLELMSAVVDKRLASYTVVCDPRPAVCVVMAAGGYPGQYEKGQVIQGLETAASLPDTVIFHAGTAVKNGVVVTNGGRVLGVTARGDSIAHAIERAYAAVRSISWHNVHYRHDIGRRALGR